MRGSFAIVLALVVCARAETLRYGQFRTWPNTVLESREKSYYRLENDSNTYSQAVFWGLLDESFGTNFWNAGTNEPSGASASGKAPGLITNAIGSYSYVFDGTDDKIRMNQPAKFRSRSEGSMAAWVSVDVWNSRTNEIWNIWDYDGASADGYLRILSVPKRGSNVLFFAKYKLGSGEYYQAWTLGAIASNEFVHLAWSVASGGTSIYTNGILASVEYGNGSAADTTWASDVIDDTTDISNHIGAKDFPKGTYVNHFDGKMGDLLFGGPFGSNTVYQHWDRTRWRYE